MQGFQSLVQQGKVKKRQIDELQGRRHPDNRDYLGRFHPTICPFLSEFNIINATQKKQLLRYWEDSKRYPLFTPFFPDMPNSATPRYHSYNKPVELRLDAYRNIRVIQKNLIHVIGLPEEVCKDDKIKTAGYFGKYGTVEKYAFYPITSDGNKKRIYSYTAFITYATELEASLAILALDGKTISDRLLRVSFGTSKYCNYFTRNIECPNIKECLYLHQWQRENEVTISQENSRMVFKSQYKIALQVCKEDLELILRRKHIDNVGSEFPTVQQALYALVEEKVITEQAFYSCLSKVDPQQSLSQISSTLKITPKVQTNREAQVVLTANQPLTSTADQLVEKSLFRKLSRPCRVYSALGFPYDQRAEYLSDIREYFYREVMFSQLYNE